MFTPVRSCTSARSHCSKMAAFGRVGSHFMRSTLTCTSRFTFKPVRSAWKSEVFVRASSGNVLKRIEEKRQAAELGGGQKRIDTQHKKVKINNNISTYRSWRSNRYNNQVEFMDS